MPLVSSACHKLISSRALPFCKQIGRCFLNKPLSYLHANHLKLSTQLNSQSDSCPLPNRPIKGPNSTKKSDPDCRSCRDTHSLWPFSAAGSMPYFPAHATISSSRVHWHSAKQLRRCSLNKPLSHLLTCTAQQQHQTFYTFNSRSWSRPPLHKPPSESNGPSKHHKTNRTLAAALAAAPTALDAACLLSAMRPFMSNTKMKRPHGVKLHTLRILHRTNLQPRTQLSLIHIQCHTSTSVTCLQDLRFKSTTGSQSRHVLPSQAAPPIHVTIWRPIRTQCIHGWHYRVSKCTQSWRAIVGPPLGEHFRCCVREAAANRTAPLEIQPARRQARPNNRTHLQPNSISIPTRLSYSLYLSSPLSPYRTAAAASRPTLATVATIKHPASKLVSPDISSWQISSTSRPTPSTMETSCTCTFIMLHPKLSTTCFMPQLFSTQNRAPSATNTPCPKNPWTVCSWPSSSASLQPCWWSPGSWTHRPAGRNAKKLVQPYSIPCATHLLSSKTNHTDPFSSQPSIG